MRDAGAKPLDVARILTVLYRLRVEYLLVGCVSATAYVAQRVTTS